MKKSLILLLAVATFSTLNAQRFVTFGPKVGFTTSKLSTNQDDIEEAFKANFQFGAFLRMGKRTFIQPELNFVTKGGLFTRDQVIGLKEVDLKTVEGAMIVGSKLFDIGTVSIAFLAGPSFSSVLEKSFRFRDGVEPIDPAEMKDRLQDAIWGIQAGVGLDALMFTLHVKYEWGLNDMIKYQNVEMNNALINVSLGWKLL